MHATSGRFPAITIPTLVRLLQFLPFTPCFKVLLGELVPHAKRLHGVFFHEPTVVSKERVMAARNSSARSRDR